MKLFVPVEPTAWLAANGAADPVCVCPALTCATDGAVADRVTTTYSVPLPSFVLTVELPVVLPVAEKSGLVSVGAVVSAADVVSPVALVDTALLLVAASVCTKCG